MHNAIDRVRVADLVTLSDIYVGRTSPGGLKNYPPWREGSSSLLISPPRHPASDSDRVSKHNWATISQLAFCGFLDSVHGAGGMGGRAGGLRPNDFGREFVLHVLKQEADG